ncbi:hypothetical protein RN001_000072 [Aquatica leii]|uniref:Uncharacterized protein n=1 Tax=Aquatica leii TaxID=1421715 RepID=A0AAN7SBZ9_9COLE|nr:hypothetical protein RN001_000072 [Aquatica leii]
MLRPYPLRKQSRTRGRKKGKCSIITDTPEKHELMKAKQERNNKMTDTDENISLHDESPPPRHLKEYFSQIEQELDPSDVEEKKDSEEDNSTCVACSGEFRLSKEEFIQCHEFKQTKRRNYECEGNTEDKSLYNVWHQIASDVEGLPKLVSEDPALENDLQTPPVSPLDASILTDMLPVDKPKEVPVTSNDSSTALAATSRPDRVEQVTRNICFAQKTICSKVFYNVLPYPKENNTDSKKKRKKEYTPSVITSDKWVEYHEECERLKMEKEREKQERKQARESIVQKAFKVDDQQSDSGATGTGGKGMLSQLDVDPIVKILKVTLVDKIKTIVQSTLKIEIQKFENSVQRLSDIFDGFKLRLDKKDTDKKMENLTAENATLKKELNDLQQYTRHENIIITGIPESSGESVINIITSLFKVINNNTSENEISVARRMPITGENKVKPIIRNDKTNWLADFKKMPQSHNSAPGITASKL